MRNRSGLFPVLISPPMIKRMLATGEGQEFRRANLSPVMKSATTGKNTRAHLAKAWEMML